jgi:hypothetical protein
MDVFTARYTFLNNSMAMAYGVPGPATSAEWQRVDFAADLPRAGFITNPSLLALHGREHGSAIVRGKFVREVLLCQPLPPPPPDVPALDEPKANETEQQHLERHRKDPSCNGCHDLIDPIGAGLAQFDWIGRHVPATATGVPIANTGVINGIPNSAFTGPVELANEIRAIPEVSSCMVRTIAEYLLGRPVRLSDGVLMAQLATTFNETGQLQETMVTFIKSDAFLYYKREAP